MGELGWTRERWRDSTFAEFNYAVEGYWRNWERHTGLIIREISFVLISGNPNIKSGVKPASSKDYMPLSIDKETKKAERLTEEEIIKIREEAKQLWQKNSKQS